MRLSAVWVGVLLSASLAAGQETGPEELFNQAHQAQQSGKVELAIQKYKELIQIHPEVVAAHANLGVVLVSLGRYDEAITEYHVALTEAPGSAPLVLDLALAYYKKGDFAAAASHFAALHKENPADLRVGTLLGKCEIQLGLIGQALAVLEPLEKSNGDNLDLEWALGTAMLRSGENLEGVKRIQKVADQAQNADAYQLAANVYLGLTFFDNARRDAEAVLRLNPKSPKAHIVLGMIDDFAGNANSAAKEYEKALEIDPNDMQARIRLASALYSQRRLDAARQEATRVLNAVPDAYGALFIVAEVELAERKLQEAQKDFEKVTQESPDWIQPHVQLAALYYRLKRPADGDRERAIVDRLRDQEQKRREQAHVITPQVAPQFVSPEIPPR
ncbi:MAG: hypothetical protein DMG69_27665 [Acidobacteria bacterium]|nr:MAG: hypothetical protein DMG69_27665 [Acidobacteriota bacterium]